MTMDAAQVIAALERAASKQVKDGMARYAIPSHNAFGVPMREMLALAKQIGRDHALAEALWKSGHYEARIVASLVDDPARVTAAQMDRWAKDFDSWAIVDTVCFKLFDRSPHAWKKIAPWCKHTDENIRRAGFVLIACLAAHDRDADDAAFTKLLPTIERGATDDRNFVKKGVSWALRMIGRRGPALRAEALAVAKRLAASDNSAARWVGKDTVRELDKPKPKKRSKS